MAVEESPKKESTVVTSKNMASTVETTTYSLVLKIIDELKKENETVRERLYKQDETNKDIKGMLVKQEESNNQIKNLLEALFTRLPPPSQS